MEGFFGGGGCVILPASHKNSFTSHVRLFPVQVSRPSSPAFPLGKPRTCLILIFGKREGKGRKRGLRQDNPPGSVFLRRM